ncbi:hypothetical protein [Pyrodictium occultum]|uniref:hypothetical protein n=1 Tax=Pyrodictium occultum TaxID=2309 RepID=UPI0014436FC5|nr:hypothetical protein [Pyrodictium occultum]
MIALILLLILGSMQHNPKSLLLVALSTAITPIIVMTSTKHPLPLGDDARFIGFAQAIYRDGRWIPFKYQENTYYQPFHLIPFLEYILAVLLGLNLKNIEAYYLLLKFSLWLTYMISTYLVIKNLSNDYSKSLVGILLLSITPPIALTQVVHQAYAIVLFLITASVLVKEIRVRQSLNTLFLVIIVLWIAGIIAHATYTVMFLAFILPLFLIEREGVSKKNIALLSATLVSISIIYWTYLYMLDEIVRSTISATTRLIDLLIGRTPFSPFHGTAKPWYTSSTSTFFIAWAFVPSIVASYILLLLSKIIFKHWKYSWSFMELLGFLGLSGTAVNYILRALSTFGGRYFYWLYILMIPLATMVVKKVSRSPLSLLPSIILISTAAFYGIQDPTMAANTYGNYIGWADRTSWHIALELQPYLGHRASKWIDPRLSAPLSSTAPLPAGNGRINYQQKVAIIGVDKVGLKGASKDPRNVDWFIRNFNVEPHNIMNKLDEFSVILNIDKYIGIWGNP